MEDVRFFIGAILALVMPVVLAFWFTIHLGRRFWRRRPAFVAYTVALVAMLVTGAGSSVYLDLLVGRDLGWQPVLFAAGAGLYALFIVGLVGVRRHLAFATFAGVPEVTGVEQDLLRDGPFSVVRHPRYLAIIVGIVGFALMSHHAGAYVVGAGTIVGLVLVAVLEERELRERFSRDYDDYVASTPMLLPRPRELRHWFRKP